MRLGWARFQQVERLALQQHDGQIRNTQEVAVRRHDDKLMLERARSDQRIDVADQPRAIGRPKEPAQSSITLSFGPRYPKRSNFTGEIAYGVDMPGRAMLTNNMFENLSIGEGAARHDPIHHPRTDQSCRSRTSKEQPRQWAGIEKISGHRLPIGGVGSLS